MKKIDILVLVLIIIGMLMMIPIHLLSVMSLKMPGWIIPIFFGELSSFSVIVDILLIVYFIIMFSAIICILSREIR